MRRAFFLLQAHPWISRSELADHCKWLNTEAGYILFLLWADGFVGRRRASAAGTNGIGIHGRAWLYSLVPGAVPPGPILTVAKG